MGRAMGTHGHGTGSRGAKLLVPNSKSGATSAKWSLAPEMPWHQNSVGVVIREKEKVHDIQNKLEKLEVDLARAIKAKQAEHDKGKGKQPDTM
ncbi:hypothetical protein Tco_0901497 [Tanacetum coccineum]